METVTRTQLEVKMEELENQLLMVWQFSFDKAKDITDDEDNNVNMSITWIQAELMKARKELKSLN